MFNFLTSLFRSYFFDDLSEFDHHCDLKLVRKVCDMANDYISTHKRDNLVKNIHLYNNVFEELPQVDVLISVKNVEYVIWCSTQSINDRKHIISAKESIHSLVEILPRYIIYQFKLMIIDLFIYHDQLITNEFILLQIYISDFEPNIITDETGMITYFYDIPINMKIEKCSKKLQVAKLCCKKNNGI